MNMNKNMIAAVLATLAMGSVATTANAADPVTPSTSLQPQTIPAVNQGSGTVTFTGSIIAAPCSIAPGNTDQTVDLGSVSNKALEKGGQSSPAAFDIKLQGCDIASLANKTVTTTFTGTPAAGNPDNLGLTGSAKGASIVLSQGGTDIKLGQPSPAFKLSNSNTAISFAAFLQGDGGSAVIVPGDFKSVANFTLAYQ
ncbi:fimbrial protein [Serratia proteamaculans]|uniref:fimbrial protein n=1 Tax=Serratia proteamaculans TaxID=28151 RepID=UPI001C57D81B|nr:fimbrial protein [Serratia proteamaculans]WEO92194.1 fimbrial protein [Serratia proteamaculans]